MRNLQLHLRLLGILDLSWKSLTVTILAHLTMAATLAASPLPVQQLLNDTFINNDPVSAQSAILILLLLFGLRGLACFVGILSSNQIGNHFSTSLRHAFFDKLLSLPIQQYPHLQDNNEIETLIHSIDPLAQATIRFFTTLVYDGMLVTGLMACVLHLNDDYALLLFLILPLLILILQVMHDQRQQSDHRHHLASRQLLQRLSESLQHYREIHLHAGYSTESERLDKVAEPLTRIQHQQGKLSAMTMALGQILMAAIAITMLYLLSQQALHHQIDLGQATALIAVSLLLIAPIRRIARVSAKLRYNAKVIQPLLTFLDQSSGQTGKTDIPRHARGKLVFEQVRFYGKQQTRPLLNLYHFSIKPGESIVITGCSATEKDAFIDLLLGLQQPDCGTILFDDHPLETISLRSWHAHIALITQNAVLLDEKIAGNIAYGDNRCANEAEITAAAQASGAMAFIRQLPEGLQTQAGDSTTPLTTKQRQQIAIARAILRNPGILILDDFPRQEECNDNDLLPVLEALIENRTTLIFSQQVPSLKNIDRIIVLEDGGITEKIQYLDYSPHY